MPALVVCGRWRRWDLPEMMAKVTNAVLKELTTVAGSALERMVVGSEASVTEAGYLFRHSEDALAAEREVTDLLAATLLSVAEIETPKALGLETPDAGIGLGPVVKLKGDELPLKN
jgi:hypothetical protein